MNAVSLWSLLQIAAGFGVSASLGFGVAYALLPGSARRNVLLVAPVLGYALLSLLATLASGNFGLRAGIAVWAAAALLLAVSAMALRDAVRAGCVAEMRQGGRPALWGLAVMLGIAFWPVLHQGTGLYLGTANPDFYQSLSYQEALLRFDLSALDPRPPDDYSLDPFFGSFPDAIPARFMGVMFSILQQHLFGLLPRTALMNSLVVFLLGMVPATCLVARLVLSANDRVVALAGVLIAVSAPVTMSFIHVLVGQNSSLALLPLGIAVGYLAVSTRALRPLVLTLLILEAGFWMYVMILPYIVAPLGLFAAYQLMREREGAAAWLARALAVVAGGAVLLQLGMGRGAAHLVADIVALLGRANRSVYIDFLTEMSLPYSVGLVSYPVGSSVLLAHFRGPDVRVWSAGLVILAMAVLAFYFACVVAWSKRAAAPNRRFVAITLGVYLAVWCYFTFVSLYGYAVFKMASWLQFFFVPFVAWALDALVLSRMSWRRAPWASAGAAASCAVLIAGNVIAALDFGAKGLGNDRHKGAIVNSYGIGGNADYLALERALRRIGKPGDVVEVGMPDYIANLWTAYYVVKAGLRAAFLSHDDFPDEDVVLPDVKTGEVRNSAGQRLVYRPRYSHPGSPDFYLIPGSGNLNQEIVERAAPVRAAWSDDSFLLIRSADAHDLVLTGRGFYRLEYFDRTRYSWWWPERMRWTPEGGEVLLLGASRPDLPHYVSFVAVAGKEREMPRHVQVWFNGGLVGESVVHGAARIAAGPFHPTGGRDKIVIKVLERVALSPRNFGLWNRQIASDQRHLNIFVAQVRVSSGALSAASMPAGIYGPKDVIERSVRFDGLSLDGWAGPQAQFDLRMDRPVHLARLRLAVPGWAGFRFPLVVTFSIDGRIFERRIDSPGEHVVELPLDPGQSAVHMRFACEQSTPIPGVGQGTFLLRSLELR